MKNSLSLLKVYVAYSLALMVYIVISSNILHMLEVLASNTYNAFITIPGNIVVSLLFGVILGTESFVKERRKSGKWKLNKEKFLLVGLPPLIFTTLISFTGLDIPSFNIFGTLSSTNLSMILLGFILITSFHKDQKEEVSIQTHSQID
ncbi:hypothetical protein CLPU_18c00500 [Gottschalkia purinilytica]|uniref:Uncharacterized protein n=1 Tax=Gottschalkia purinilytica TaxID=1503 RepID=A0A0L0W741_GOTPU|nr:hypothetical protein [Gottschalkia purinilytica]KNF07368.1 hypothetical protein CLPU_18c00500 [Gottschalkia purinilytica]